MTDRQMVVKYFAEKEVKFKEPVDLAVELRNDQIGPNELKKQSEYVDKVLRAGYRSELTKNLFNDINDAKPGKVDELETKE